MVQGKLKRDYSITIQLKEEHVQEYVVFFEELARYQKEQSSIFEACLKAMQPYYTLGKKKEKSFLFRKTGEGFEIVYKGKPSLFMKNSVGLTYIYFLLAHPNKPVSVEQLTSVRQENRVNRNLQLPSSLSSEKCSYKEYKHNDLEPVIDQLKKLREEKQQANESGYYKRAEELQYTIEELESYITHAWNAKSDPQLEKLRTGVKNAINKAIERIDQYDPDLAEYLKNGISTGYTCMYKNPPSEKIRWHFS